ncbi:unnamed protein product [Didymodactylos carnosus]|uniref:Transposase n=1 Tax=Didymodactylos carnosus TaxID=1234261 RepID=A0A814RV47_9BILA|nr:unnamed protein product [Didymodactylos carnosus]CAF3902521.1 unnamed protein product [Didymodactylos carnosus]
MEGLVPSYQINWKHSKSEKSIKAQEKSINSKTVQKQVEPLLTDDHKIKRQKFANWIRTNFRKEETMRILFSDEKMFDIDGVYNAQNDRVWAVDRAEADKKDDTNQKRQFP